MMYEIRKLRRDGMPKPEQTRIRHEDEREERELQAYVMRSLTKDMLHGMPGSQAQAPQNHKLAEREAEAQQNTPYIPEQPRRDGR